jgi:H+/Cl- antiporter ClcA
MGFALLSGATAPIACTLMGIELLGLRLVYFLCIACSMAYFVQVLRGFTHLK